MIIIYGRRSYGEVERTEHEYVRTRFAHIYFMPLVPTDSMWMTGPDTGIPIKMHGKSVLAAYLRWWSLPIAAACVATGSLVVGLPIAVALVALWGYQWTWSSVRGDHELMRRHFNRLAFGTRCEPRHMDQAQRMQLESHLRARWDALEPGRSPNEVATYGAKSPAEAVVAYGLLRLSALQHPGGDEAGCAERILRGTHEVPTDDAGPYRENAAAAVNAAADVHAQVAAAAATSDATAVQNRTYAAAHRQAYWAEQKRVSRPLRIRKIALVIAALAAIGGVGGVLENGKSLLGNHYTPLETLAQDHSKPEYVKVPCETLVRVDTFANKDIYLCRSGDLNLAVQVDAGDAVQTDDSMVAGKLEWERGGNTVTQRGAVIINAVLDANRSDRLEALIALVILGLGSIASLVLFLQIVRIRKQAAQPPKVA